MYAFMLMGTMRSYLMAQGMFIPQVVVQVFTSVMHWFWCYLFCEKMNLDVEGIALAQTVTYVSGAILLYKYLAIMKPRPGSWFFFRKESFTELW